MMTDADMKAAERETLLGAHGMSADACRRRS
jgi:hypothetical protein